MTDAKQDARAMARWHWRTWDTLKQIEQATDGKAPCHRGQEEKDMIRGLGIENGPELRAFERFGLVICICSGEVSDDDGGLAVDSKGAAVIRGFYAITAAGRAALHSRVGAKAKRDAMVPMAEEGT